MARPRTGDKDGKLVEAAIALFLERGVRGTTMQDIARGAGVAVGTVYLYYKDKAAIVRRVALAFAERHDAFVAEVLGTRRGAKRKLLDYVLGFYDMWQPFGQNSQGPVELAEAVLAHAPEAPRLAQERFIETVAVILGEAKEAGLKVENSKAEARWIALCTTAFFPLAGTPSGHPLQQSLGRDELEGLLKWILGKLEG
ncbi:TetR/AcrR family transcriptional regulator [Pelagicoccus sp. SDUM812005]|uniref:TetR/AcrR family transcriptional regulator n=1 Tax=Pelagicoccus sp. SDUM812005 TaxID=3041257 RepID=UPI00280EAEC6|nr:TetR/AcrR family transcriptional regulator [Pelagicoccus sp. SDUM812005]MDQ8182641.1 TetR/AcrR family transcriptional regulator [Pelagicoccus sp. SDUM812005]